MRIAIAAAVLALSACGKEPAIATAPAAPPAPATTEAPAPEIIAAEGWETTHALVGKPTPFFSLHKVGGDEVTRDQLRGRWTILGFWNATLAGVEQETRYLRALNSAVDQDPDLDLLTIYLKLDATDTDVGKWFANNGGDPWPTLLDDGATGEAFAVTVLPAYFLIGPDLTIHAARPALSDDPDGIKSVIRGVAEIRKKASAPT